MRFGVSQFTTTPWGFERDVEEYARLGVDAIEVCEDKLDEDRFAGQLELVEEHGLMISSVQPSVRTLFPSRTQPGPEDPLERAARFQRTVERVAPFAPGAPFVCNTGPPPGGNVERVYETAAREYRKLADFAGEHGARIALEPLNPALMNVETAIWTLEQATSIVSTVDRDNFGLCVDLWNVWQNPDVAGQIRACGGRIFVVHVADWRTPRSFEDRRVVGWGEIPFPELLRAVHESGYRGAYTLEIFSGDVPDSLWDADLSGVIEKSRAGLEEAWRDTVGPARDADEVQT